MGTRLRAKSTIFSPTRERAPPFPLLDQSGLGSNGKISIPAAWEEPLGNMHTATYSFLPPSLLILL